MISDLVNNLFFCLIFMIWFVICLSMVYINPRLKNTEKICLIHLSCLWN